MYVFIIPEGLSEIDNKIEPSFVYKSVLNFALENYLNNKIFLMPANKFNYEVSEQKAAYDYLLKFGKQSFFFNPRNNGYICTVKNIYLTKAYLQDNEKMIDEASIIICGKYHLLRVWLVCKLLGFPAKNIIPVNYSIVNEKIVSRLWYYKNPYIHVFYETFAIFQSLYKILYLKIRGI